MKEGSVAIVGAGAVGQMLAFFLRAAGVPQIVCYGRKGPVALAGRVLFQDQTTPLVSDSPGPEPQLWLFATKAYDLVPALEQWLPRISVTTALTILSNGFIEPALAGIRQRFPQHELRKGVVSRGARILPDGTLALSPKGEVRWGSRNAPQPFETSLMQALASQGFHWDPEVCGARREKWFCNTVLNTLCAAYRLKRNAEAEEQKEFSALCHEVYELGCEFWPEWKGQEAALKQRLVALIATTADNENSMAVDIRLGRKTESAFLSGHVLCCQGAAERFPHLNALHAQLSLA